MSNAKEFYKTYVADPNLSTLNDTLIDLIRREFPLHVFEFGMGQGKNLSLMSKKGIETFGVDVSFMNVINSFAKFDLQHVIKSDESVLRHLCNFDVVFTCSVLDHIENIDDIIVEFKRIANKSVFLAETLDEPAPYYFPHNYESYGFEKLDFNYKSNGDGATYFIYKWTKK